MLWLYSRSYLNKFYCLNIELHVAKTEMLQSPKKEQKTLRKVLKKQEEWEIGKHSLECKFKVDHGFNSEENQK